MAESRNERNLSCEECFLLENESRSAWVASFIGKAFSFSRSWICRNLFLVNRIYLSTTKRKYERDNAIDGSRTTIGWVIYWWQRGRWWCLMRMLSYLKLLVSRGRWWAVFLLGNLKQNDRSFHLKKIDVNYQSDTSSLIEFLFVMIKSVNFYLVQLKFILLRTTADSYSEHFVNTKLSAYDELLS